MKFFKEFKEFVSRGNVIDMAVGIIIGSAFTAIITALVGNILTPLLQYIGVGDNGYGALQVVLKEATETEPAIIMDFGIVISAIITFLLTALILFIIIKIVGGAKKHAEKLAAKKEQETPPAPAPQPEPTPDEVQIELLKEIRDLMKK